jgi:hypothetical protein
MVMVILKAEKLQGRSKNYSFISRSTSAIISLAALFLSKNLTLK